MGRHEVSDELNHSCSHVLGLAERTQREAAPRQIGDGHVAMQYPVGVGDDRGAAVVLPKHLRQPSAGDVFEIQQGAQREAGAGRWATGCCRRRTTGRNPREQC